MTQTGGGMTQTVDHVALLPVYLAAGTALVALLADLAVARRVVTVTVTGLGAAGVAVAAVVVGYGPTRETFCFGGQVDACSYVAEPVSALLSALFAGLGLAVLGLSARTLRDLPAGEYCFLLAASVTGGVALAHARDVITLVVALETLTLPLYALVALRRRTLASAQAAVTFLVTSVVATTVALLGAALLYAGTGAVHLPAIADALAGGVPDQLRPLATVGAGLLLAGVAFKAAAVPFHAWAPATYDGAPVPVAAYLSTASKLGGVVAVLYVVVGALRPWPEVAGPVLAALAVATMTVGNLVALRQRRMVRLLAWSSVAQSGYILAPLGVLAVAAGRTDDMLALAVTATVAYAIFYVTIEVAAFGSVVALRGVPEGEPDGGPDGGTLAAYRGAGRRAPWTGAVFALALIGLAGLPPGLAGTFAKVAVVRALLNGGAAWLAVVVAINAVIGLAYYLWVVRLLYAPATESGGEAPRSAPRLRKGPMLSPRPEEGTLPQGGGGRTPWPVAAVLGAATVVAVGVGFAPQLVLDAAGLATSLLR